MSGAAADHNCHLLAESGPQAALSPSVIQNLPGALYFSLNAESGQILWTSGNTNEVLGLSEQAVAAHGAILRARIHHDDRFAIENLLERSLAEKLPFIATYRWIRPDSGSLRFLHCRAIFRTDNASLTGIVVDITDILPLLQGMGVTAVTLGENLTLMGIHGMTLDLDLSIRTATSSAPPNSLSFGRDDWTGEPIVPGQSFLKRFQSEHSKKFVSTCFDSALSAPDQHSTLEWAGYRAIIRTLSPQGNPEGFLLYVVAIDEEQRLRDENNYLKSRLKQLEASALHAQELLNLSQESLGYAAIIKRQTGDTPLVKHMAQALATSVKELSERAREISTPLLENAPTQPAAPKLLIRSRKSTHSPAALYAASSNSVSHTHAALLSDAGISTRSCTLDDESVRSIVKENPSLRALVLDIAKSSPQHTALIRSIRRFFPALHIVALVPGAVTHFSEIQRAGAILVLAKPVAPRELERVVRGLLHLSLAMDSATDEHHQEEVFLPPATEPQPANRRPVVRK
jgi:hypothetical protein